MRQAPSVVMLLMLLSACACAAPRAYERGRLAKPKTQAQQDPDAVILEQHVFEYREGSAGGYGGGGGGCGRN